MDRKSILLQLAQQVSEASAASDWSALGTLNTMMSSTLPPLAAAGPWLPAERAALAALYQVHLQAVHVAGLASAELSQKMGELQTNKEGWMAYAMSNADLETRERGSAADIGTTV